MAPALKPKPPISVRLPADLEQRLRQLAADAGVPVNAVICRAVADHLDAREGTKVYVTPAGQIGEITR